MINAFDPGLPEGAPGHSDFSELMWCKSVEDAVDGADVAVIVTDWDEFRSLDLSAIARRMASPILVDLRNLFDPATVTAAGLDYISLGRAAAFAHVRRETFEVA